MTPRDPYFQRALLLACPSRHLEGLEWDVSSPLSLTLVRHCYPPEKRSAMYSPLKCAVYKHEACGEWRIRATRIDDVRRTLRVVEAIDEWARREGWPAVDSYGREYLRKPEEIPAPVYLYLPKGGAT